MRLNKLLWIIVLFAILAGMVILLINNQSPAKQADDSVLIDKLKIETQNPQPAGKNVQP